MVARAAGARGVPQTILYSDGRRGIVWAAFGPISLVLAADCRPGRGRYAVHAYGRNDAFCACYETGRRC
jgi:hypothetical protein